MSVYLEVGLFVLTAMVTVIAAVSLVLHVHLRIAAVALAASLSCAAVLLLTLRAPVPAAMLLLLDAVAAVVLLLAAYRLLDPQGEVPPGKGESFQRGMSLFTGACLLGLLGLALRRTRDPFAIRSLDGEPLGSLAGFGRHLLRDHLASVGLTGFLILVTLAAAVALGRSFLETGRRP